MAMISTLRYATALTDLREHERLDQSLLQSVTELALAHRGPSAPKPRHLVARLWRLSGNDEDATLVLAAQTNASPTCTTNFGQGRTADAAARKAISKCGVATALRPGADGGQRCCTWVAVARRKEVMGLLELESSAPLSASRLNIIEGMCSLYANHLSLLHDSQVDTLTRLLNRKTFDDSIQRVLALASPQAPQTWVAVIDIDHFKMVNDGYGHLFGDEVLLLVADMLKRGFRQQDKVFRYGGEEFVVLLHHADEASTIAALERLRHTIEQHRFPQVGRITVSIGATAIQAGDAACDALGRADDALYHAKSHGRNQVRLFERLRAGGVIAPAATLHGDVDLF